MVKAVRKVCARCGQVSLVKPRERKCKRSGRNAHGFRTGYLCWGSLSPVKPLKPAKAKPVKLSDADYAQRYRDRAARKRDVSTARLEKWQRRLKAVEAALDKWEARVTRWTRHAAMTDAEILAVRDRIKIAHRVNIVRRRLLGKGLPKSRQELLTA